MIFIRAIPLTVRLKRDIPLRTLIAGLAQLVEHLICNQGVVGSSPTTGTISNGLFIKN